MARDGRQIRLERPFFRVEPLPGPRKTPRTIRSRSPLHPRRRPGRCGTPPRADRCRSRSARPCPPPGPAPAARAKSDPPSSGKRPLSVNSLYLYIIPEKANGDKRKNFFGFCAQKTGKWEQGKFFAAKLPERAHGGKRENIFAGGCRKGGREQREFFARGCQNRRTGRRKKIFCGKGAERGGQKQENHFAAFSRKRQARTNEKSFCDAYAGTGRQ